MKSAYLILGVLVAFFVVSTITFASIIDEHQINIFLSKEGSAIIKARVKYAELTTEDVPYFMMVDVRRVNAYADGTQLNCTVSQRPYGTYISCMRPDTTTPLYNYTVEFEIYTSKLTTYNGGVYRFLYNYGVREPTKKISVVLYLPEGYALVKESRFREKPYYPQNGITGSDGRRLTITWGISNPKLGETLSFSALYEYVGTTSTNMTPYYLSLPVMLALFYIVLRRRKTDVMEVLTDDERAIIDVLKEAGNRMIKQKDIVKATNFSKAKVSRLLAELEERGLVKRERVGRTNRVKLVKKV